MKKLIRLLTPPVFALLLSCCSSDSASDGRSGSGGGYNGGTGGPQYVGTYRWTKSEFDQEVGACVSGAMAGHSGNTEWETAAKKYCSCAFTIVTNEYSYSSYSYQSDTILNYLSGNGSFDPCL